MNVVNNILGIKPKCDKRSKNMMSESDKNLYYRGLKEMSDDSLVLKNARMFSVVKSLEDKYPEETSNIRKATNITKNVPW